MIYRYKWVSGQLINPKPLLQLPANPGATGRPDHNGGKLAIGPDGNVYAVIGEVGGHQTQAANLENGSSPDGTGGVMRVTPDGLPVPNGPFRDKPPINYYFGYGIRNSFGIGFDPVSGKLGILKMGLTMEMRLTWLNLDSIVDGNLFKDLQRTLGLIILLLSL